MKRHEDPTFLEMRKGGASYDAIGKAFSVSGDTVRRWVMDALKAGLIKTRYPEWTAKKIGQIRDMWQAGSSDEEIGNLFSVSRRTIEALRNKHGISRARPAALWTAEKLDRLRELAAKGLSDSKIATELGSTTRAVRQTRGRYGIPTATVSFWTDERKQTAIVLTNSGVGPAEIARRLGATKNQVEGLLARSGVQRKGLAYPPKRKEAVRAYNGFAEACRAAARKPRAQPGPKEDTNVIPMTARPWLTRERGECVYPYGPRGQIHSCCQPVWNDTTYCESHFALCHDERKPKRAA